MELEHNFVVAAPVNQAWEVLLDLDRIAPCLPGAALTSFDGDEFTGTVRVKVGPVTMAFGGSGRFVERDIDGHRMVIEAAGKETRGGGTARATIRATLRAEGAGTAVAVHTDLAVTGRVAQFGRNMIADVSTRLLGQFTECLAVQLAAPAGAVAAPAPAPAAEPAAAGGSAAGGSAAPAEPRAVQPIDLLGVTGVRAAAGRLAGYLLVFLAGALAGGLLVGLLVR